MIGSGIAFARFVAGFRRHLRDPLSEARALEQVRERRTRRGEALLALLDKGVWARKASPYRALLEAAGCEPGDVAAMVRSNGVEETLEELRNAGVFVTFEEFKGRRPIVRGSFSLSVRDRDFDNPHLSSYYLGSSGGTTGPGTRVPIDLEHLAAQGPHELLATAAHGLVDAPTATWLGTLPSFASLGVLLRRARFGRGLDRWFAPVARPEIRPSLKGRGATWFVVRAGQAAGMPFPFPERVPLNEAATIAHWVHDTVQRVGSCVVVTHVSCALRICVAATQLGLDLSGAVMWAGSEPPTTAKVRLIEASGARWVPGYWITEAGFLGQGCGAPRGPNDVHLFDDAFAVITRPLAAFAGAPPDDAFYLTTLLPSAPKLMLNVEVDDCGTVERRACGCPLDAAGFGLHLRDIHSLRKLTGEGMSVLHADVERIVDVVLPERFGGTPLDYQIREEEDEEGLTRIVLAVRPGIAEGRDDEIAEAFTEWLAASRDGGLELAGATWRQARTVRVRRVAPCATSQGKLLPLFVARRS